MNRLLVLLLIFGTLQSCAYKFILDTPTIQAYDISRDELQQIQFYNSQEVVLTRLEQESSGKETSAGKLSVFADKDQEKIIIKERTKGKLIRFMEDNQIAVSFEPNEDLFLIFEISSESDVYRLNAISWEDGRGTILYGDKKYLTDPFAHGCNLEFKLKRRYRTRTNARIAKGNKI